MPSLATGAKVVSHTKVFRIITLQNSKARELVIDIYITQEFLGRYDEIASYLLSIT